MFEVWTQVGFFIGPGDKDDCLHYLYSLLLRILNFAYSKIVMIRKIPLIEDVTDKKIN